jgi:voltage-gated potassium channel
MKGGGHLREPTEREVAAYRIAQRLDRPIATLGVVALGLWLVEPVTSSKWLLQTLVDVLWIGIALAFLVEFVARAIVAPETWPFLRQHWWEAGLIALPFLRFLRVLRAGRAGRGVASAVHSSRRAGVKLRSRLTLLLVVTAVVSCAAGRLLWEFGGYHGSYPDALHDAAMSTVTGASLGSGYAFAQVLEIVLGAYSAVIIATIAGALGAYFIQARTEPLPVGGPWWENRSGVTVAPEGEETLSTAD